MKARAPGAIEAQPAAQVPVPAAPAQPPAVVRPVPAPVPALVPAVAGASATRWAPFGTYTPGQRVQFYLSTGWRTGTVREVGSTPTGARYAAVYDKKYRIASDKFPDSPEWVDWGTVAGLERAPFWTNFFVGDWATGEVMAVNTRIEGRLEVSEYSYHAATEALRVNADGTYLWKPLGSPEIRGRWKPAGDGPGVVLMNGYRKLDWTLRNETNATEEIIRRNETARLYADGQTSIRAKRTLAAAKPAR